MNEESKLLPAILADEFEVQEYCLADWIDGLYADPRLTGIAASDDGDLEVEKVIASTFIECAHRYFDMADPEDRSELASAFSLILGLYTAANKAQLAAVGRRKKYIGADVARWIRESASPENIQESPQEALSNHREICAWASNERQRHQQQRPQRQD